MGRLIIGFTAMLTMLVSSYGKTTERLAPPLQEQAKISTASQGATTLYSIFDHDLSEENNWTRRQYTSIKINDLDAARDYGRISTRYSEFYQQFELEFANVLTKTGELKTLNKDAISIRNVSGNQDFYDDRKEIVFSLPQIEPGSIIEFQIKSQTKNRAIESLVSDFVAPHWIQPRVAMDGYRADAVKHFVYTRSLPSSIEFKEKTYGKINAKAKVSKKNGRTISHYQKNDIAEFIIEPSMPEIDLVRPAIAGSSSTNWNSVSQWFWQKVHPHLAVTDEIRELVSQLNIASTASDADKIKAVYDYLQNNIRYVYAHISNGGYDPHSPEEVLAARFGDCKDQTVLAITLLKALNIEAFPLLIQTPRSGKADTSLVSLIFDHVIVFIPEKDTRDAIYLDTTADRALFPGVSAYLAGQPALIASPTVDTTFKFKPSTDKNHTDVKLKYSLGENRQIILDAKLSFQGSAEQGIRSWWQNDHNRETSIKSFFDAILENKGQYQLSYEVKNAEDLYRPIEIQGRFTFKERIEANTPINYATSVSQLIRLIGVASGLQAPDTRKNRYVDPTHISASMQVVFSPPDTYSQALFLTADDIKTPYFSVKQNADKQANGFVVTIEFERQPLDLSVAQYADYYENTLKLGTEGSWLVSNQVDKEKLQKLSLLATQKQAGTDSIEFQLKSAKQHVDLGDFDAAMPFAKRAVELDKNNAEAWFILGTTQGYLGDIEASQNSFNKAKQLGYTP